MYFIYSAVMWISIACIYSVLWHRGWQHIYIGNLYDDINKYGKKITYKTKRNGWRSEKCVYEVASSNLEDFFVLSCSCCSKNSSYIYTKKRKSGVIKDRLTHMYVFTHTHTCTCTHTQTYVHTYTHCGVTLTSHIHINLPDHKQLE